MSRSIKSQSAPLLRKDSFFVMELEPFKVLPVLVNVNFAFLHGTEKILPLLSDSASPNPPSFA